MSIKGGYILIDMESIEIGEEAVSIPAGTYSKLIEAAGKPVIFNNLNLGGTEMRVAVPMGIVYVTDEVEFLLSPDGSVFLQIFNDDTAALVAGE